MAEFHDAAKLSEATAASLRPGELDPEREKQLALVNKFIADAKPFSYGGAFRLPFSRQYKAQIRKLFGETDRELFAAIDEDEHDTLRAAVFMRSITFTIYALNALFFVGALAAYIGGAGRIVNLSSHSAAFVSIAEGWHAFALGIIKALFPILGVTASQGDESDLFGGIFIAFLLAWIVRFLVRRTLIGDIIGQVDILSNKVKDTVSAIDADIARAIENAGNRYKNGSKWPVKAGDWIKIAAWLEERNVYIDRYVSVTIWRIEFGLTAIETFFIALNLIVAGSVFATFWGLGAMSAAPMAAIAAFLVYAVGLWSFGVRRPNSLWSDEFNRAFGRFQENKEHFYNRLGTIVANDKRQIVGNEMGSDD